MHPATEQLWMEDQHCAVQLKFCPFLAVPALLALPAPRCWAQCCASQTLGRHTVMLAGLLSPCTVLFVWKYHISRTLVHKECFSLQKLLLYYSVARMGLLLFCQGIKFHCLSYLSLWADLKQLLLIIWCFSLYQKCSFKHMPAYFNEHPPSNFFKCMVSSHEILTCILNMPRSNYFRIILKAFIC